LYSITDNGVLTQLKTGDIVDQPSSGVYKGEPADDANVTYIDANGKAQPVTGKEAKEASNSAFSKKANLVEENIDDGIDYNRKITDLKPGDAVNPKTGEAYGKNEVIPAGSKITGNDGTRFTGSRDVGGVLTNEETGKKGFIIKSDNDDNGQIKSMKESGVYKPDGSKVNNGDDMKNAKAGDVLYTYEGLKLTATDQADRDETRLWKDQNGKTYVADNGKDNTEPTRFRRGSDGQIGSFEQGSNGSCTVLATAISLNQTEEGRKILKETITDNGDGTYDVKFKGDRTNPSIRVTEEELIANNGGVTQDKDIAILELAARKYHGGINNSNYSYDGAESSETLNLLTDGHTKRASFDDTPESVRDALTQVEETSGSGNVLLSTSGWNGTQVPEGKAHALAMTNIDTKNNTVSYINPWDSDKVITQDMDEFCEEQAQYRSGRGFGELDYIWAPE